MAQRKSNEEKLLNKLEFRMERILDRSGPVNQLQVFTILMQYLLRRLTPDEQQKMYLRMLWPGQPVSAEECGTAACDRIIHDFQESFKF
jgi:hypothetical protein